MKYHSIYIRLKQLKKIEIKGLKPGKTQTLLLKKHTKTYTYHLKIFCLLWSTNLVYYFDLSTFLEFFIFSSFYSFLSF